MTEETKEQPKGLFDKFMDLYAPLAQQVASFSPQDYAQDFREKQNYVLKQLGLISPTSGVTTPENTRPAEDILMRNASQDQPTMDAVEQYVNDRVNYNPDLGPIPVKDPNNPDEYRLNQMIEMLEINRMFDGLLQSDDFALPTISVDQRAAYTSHLLSKPYDAREVLAKKLVSGDLKALEGLDDINAFYAGFDPQAAQAESTGSVALDSDFISKLRGSESSGKTSAEYKDKKGDRFVGLDQIGSPRLKDFNRATENNYTQNELKADAAKQEEVASWHYNNHADNIKKQGLDKFIGEVDPKSGAEITLSGMLAVAHLGGFGGLKKYLTDQAYTAKDALGTSLSKYMKKFSGLSVEGESSGPDLDPEGRPFLGPEVGAEVTQGSMLSGLVSSVRSALGLGSDEEAQSVAEKLMQSGVIPLPPRRPESLSVDEPMRLPPVGGPEQNNLPPSNPRLEAAQLRQQRRDQASIDLNLEEVNLEDSTKNIKYTTESALNKLVPSNARAMVRDVLYNQLGVDQTKIMRNEDFLSKEVQSEAKAYILKKIAGSNKRKGAIQYKDYPSGNEGVKYAGNIGLSHFTNPEMVLKTTLGAFTWYINDDDQIIIEDRFNFNDSEKFKKANPTLEDKIKHLKSYYDNPKTGTYGLVRRAGALFGSSEGEGAGFNINLGKLEK